MFRTVSRATAARAAATLSAALLLTGTAAEAAPRAGATTSQQPGKLLIVMLENHSEIHALDGMPKLAKLAKTYGRADNYRAITHPSLPNYLSIIGGSSFGVHDDADPGAHRIRGESVLDQAIATGHTAKTYAESMPANCTLVPDAPYAVKHNAWAYFADRTSRANCKRFDVPSGSTTRGALHNDITHGTLPTLGLLIPNLCDDAHDCALDTADAFTSSWFAAITRGADWRSGRLTVVVTFDEDDYSGPNKVLTVVLNRNLHHKVSTAALNHFSLTGYADELIDAKPLRGAATATSFARAFGL